MNKSFFSQEAQGRTRQVTSTRELLLLRRRRRRRRSSRSYLFSLFLSRKHTPTLRALSLSLKKKGSLSASSRTKKDSKLLSADFRRGAQARNRPRAGPPRPPASPCRHLLPQTTTLCRSKRSLSSDTRRRPRYSPPPPRARAHSSNLASGPSSSRVKLKHILYLQFDAFVDTVCAAARVPHSRKRPSNFRRVAAGLPPTRFSSSWYAWSVRRSGRALVRSWRSRRHASSPDTRAHSAARSCTRAKAKAKATDSSEK